ncbi:MULTISPECIES: diversity-generating retroelement protein Avd [unclassified Aeromonas]|uniref:diversity-generating retroelement protein Avd n=1 Tax=unclassified Aeromonas TaxID=257493 RepID=UPI0022E6906B|nr:MULTISPECIES: diversity-generating retroelement protein Avd [unclassified Aeromonas]
MDKQPLVIEQRIRDMMQYGHIALRQFPKSEKHVLAAEIRTSMLTLLRLVITAAKRYHKKTTLTDLDVELAVLQNQIRLAKDLTYLPINKYQHWSGLNLETVRVIGGCDAVCLTFRAGQIDELLI